MDNINKSIDILYKEYNLNNDKIKDYSEKLDILDNNSLKSRFSVGFTVGYATLTILSMSTALLGLLNVEMMISVDLFRCFSFGISLLIGAISEKIISKENRQKLGKISNSRSFRDIYKEATMYELEIVKLNNHNWVLRRCLDSLLSRSKSIESLSDNYFISRKNNDNKDEETLRNNIDLLNNEIASNRVELDDISLKRFLKSRFSNGYNYIKTFRNSAFAFIMITLYSFLFSLIFNYGSLFSLFLPGIIGSVPFLIYGIEATKMDRYLFKKISNKIVNNNAIDSLEDVIKKSYENRLIIEDNKRNLEEITKNKNKQGSIPPKKDYCDSLGKSKVLEKYKK